MADIFISYSKQDPEYTKTLAKELQRKGYTVWWDTDGLTPGDDFQKEIEKEIDAAKAVIVIWTEKSKASEWVRFEANRAYTHKKLIPTHIAGVDLGSLPVPFKGLHSDLVENTAKIVAALEKLKVSPSGTPAQPAAAKDDSASRRGRADRSAPDWRSQRQQPAERWEQPSVNRDSANPYSGDRGQDRQPQQFPPRPASTGPIYPQPSYSPAPQETAPLPLRYDEPAPQYYQEPVSLYPPPRYEPQPLSSAYGDLFSVEPAPPAYDRNPYGAPPPPPQAYQAPAAPAYDTPRFAARENSSERFYIPEDGLEAQQTPPFGYSPQGYAPAPPSGYDPRFLAQEPWEETYSDTADGPVPQHDEFDEEFPDEDFVHEPEQKRGLLGVVKRILGK